jgi:hypothetical protein
MSVGAKSEVQLDEADIRVAQDLARAASIAVTRNKSVALKPDLQTLLANLTSEETTLLTEFVEFLYWQRSRDITAQLDNQQPLDRLMYQQIHHRFDFSDLAGVLAWRGDAVRVQRELRDEW